VCIRTVNEKESFVVKSVDRLTKQQKNMTSSSSATRNLFDRPELLENQTRLILSADVKPRRLLRSATRSAGVAGVRDRSDSAASALVILETENDLIDENEDDYSVRQTAIITNDVNYDTDIEQEKEPTKDYSTKGLYLDQCHRHGVIPSTHFLRHIDNETLTIRYCGLKPINIKVMVPSLKINTYITKLDLRDNGLASRGAVYIAQLLKDNEYITELNLANNDIGLQGMKLFVNRKYLFRAYRNLFNKRQLFPKEREFLLNF
jgi:hypothetical protein